MPLHYPPKRGSILLCNFHTFREPEMTKIRPVIILSPRFNERPNLCTVVVCSKTEPHTKMPYHYEYHIDPPLPAPYNSPIQWVKGDMIYSLSITRLKFFHSGKDQNGKRIYIKRILPDKILNDIVDCVICGLTSL
jgi:mRNA interferase MazF